MEEVSIDVKPCIVYNLQQKEIHLKVKKENILEEFQCRPTSSETSTLIKEEFSVDDSDANIVIKKMLLYQFQILYHQIQALSLKKSSLEMDPSLLQQMNVLL